MGPHPRRPPPPAAPGFTLRETAKALGITFAGGTPPPPADWPARLASSKRRYSQLAGLQLSAFGRGFGCGAYGVSTFLYHAEFTGLPPPAVLEEVDWWTAKLVDRGQKPTTPPAPLPVCRAGCWLAAPRRAAWGPCPGGLTCWRAMWLGHGA